MLSARETARQTPQGNTTLNVTSKPEKRLSGFLEKRASVFRKKFGEKADLEHAVRSSLQAVKANRPGVTSLEILNSDFWIRMSLEKRNASFKELAEDIGNNSYLEKIVMVNVGANDEFGVAIAAAITKNPRIVEVNFESNDLRGPGITAIADALKSSNSLVTLRLMHQKKAIPSRALEALVAAVKDNGVTTVCGVGMRDRSLIHTLDKALRDNTDKKRIKRNSVRVAGSKIAAKLSGTQRQIVDLPNATYTELDFQDDREFLQMSDQWKNQTLCRNLSLNHTITKVILNGLKLKDAFACEFADTVLLPDTALIEFRLERNMISGKGIKAIADVLARTGVKRIAINSQAITSSISAESAMALAAADSSSLVKVCLDWRNASYRSACEKSLMLNADKVRQLRNSVRLAKPIRSDSSSFELPPPPSPPKHTQQRPADVSDAESPGIALTTKINEFKIDFAFDFEEDIVVDDIGDDDEETRTTVRGSPTKQSPTKQAIADVASDDDSVWSGMEEIAGEVEYDIVGEGDNDQALDEIPITLSMSDAEQTDSEDERNDSVSEIHDKLLRLIDSFDDSQPETSDQNAPFVELAGALPRKILELTPSEDNKPCAIVKAVESGKVGAVAALLYNGTRLQPPNQKSVVTMLQHAARKQRSNFELMELLCEHGLDMLEEEELQLGPIESSTAASRGDATTSPLPIQTKLEQRSSTGGIWIPEPSDPTRLVIESDLI